jgi:FdhE protein
VSAPSRSRIQTIAAKSPEFAPFLALIAIALEEAGAPSWSTLVSDGSIRATSDPVPSAPLLDGAEIAVPESAARRLVARLLEAASHKAAARSPKLDALALIEAAIHHDAARVAGIAEELGVDPAALAPIAQLAAMPLLLACCRALTPRIAPGFAEGYCPICGGFPTIAEVRGLTRRRRLRCGRCGGDAGFEALACVFCGQRDHLRLTALVPESGGEARKVEACEDCRGYLKMLASLTAWPAEAVLLEDLGAVALDLAAHERGYIRPAEPGRRAGVRLVATPEKKRRLWGILS